jgi:hypothetical protein
MITSENTQVRRDICGDCKTPCEDFQQGRIAFDHPCAECPIRRWGQIAVPGSCNEELPLPSLAQRAVNYAVSSIQEGQAIFQGKARITEEEAQRRQAICRSNVCKRYRASDDTCSSCGCPTRKATARRAKECPRGLW